MFVGATEKTALSPTPLFRKELQVLSFLTGLAPPAAQKKIANILKTILY
jgi:hypothetical protein